MKFDFFEHSSNSAEENPDKVRTENNANKGAQLLFYPLFAWLLDNKIVIVLLISCQYV